ncbi:hypothetical protein G6F31_013015 [Rhizopus arrhizus]|nr:hypothetical protein G6F31_013015 [Rhizopus arrhizus]
MRSAKSDTTLWRVSQVVHSGGGEPSGYCPRRRFNPFVAANRGSRRQRAHDVRSLLHASGRQALDAQSGIGRVHQLQRLAQGRALDRGDQGIAQPVARTHLGATGRAGLLLQHDARFCKRVLGAAVAAAGGRVTAAAQYCIAHTATGLCIDQRAIAQRVGARRGAGRQRADQRIAGVAGERSRLGDRLQVQAHAQRIGQHQRIGGLRIRDGHFNAVVHRIADANRCDSGGLLAVGHHRCQHRCGGAAVAGAGGGTGTTTQHRVAHAALGLRVHLRGVVHRVRTRRSPGRQRAHQRVGGIAAEALAAGHRTEVQAGAHRIGQGEHRRGARVADDGGQRVGDAVTDLDRTRRCRSLAIVDLAAGDRRGGIAVGGTGRIVAAATQHGIGDLAAGLRIHHRGVGKAVAARHGPRRQGADQRIGRVAAVGARTGHSAKVQARTQGVGQGHHIGGARVGHHRGQRIGQAIAHRDRAGAAHRLGIAHAGRRHRGGGITVGTARRIVGAAAKHGIADTGAGLRIDGGAVGQAVGARHGAGRQRAHKWLGAIAGEDACAADAAEVQAAAQDVACSR